MSRTLPSSRQRHEAVGRAKVRRDERATELAVDIGLRVEQRHRAMLPIDPRAIDRWHRRQWCIHSA